MIRVKWTEIILQGVLSDDQMSESTELKPVERFGTLICSHKSFFGRVFCIVEYNDSFIELPLSDLKPAKVVYKINDDPTVIE